MKEALKAIFGSYAEIFFFRGVFPGVVFFGLTLAHPNTGLAGIVAVLAAYVCARFIGLGREFLGSGFYIYNPLLVGLSLGYLFQFSALTCLLAAVAGILAFMLVVLLASVFTAYLRLPILSLPFVVVSTIAYLASLRYSNLLVAAHDGAGIGTYDPDWPLWLAGFFKAFGGILFAPSILVGLMFSLLTLSYSRILFLLAVLGYYTGTSARAWLTGSADQALSDMYSFNFILAAMALGGVFLVPSLRGYLLAIIAVVISTVLLDSMSVFWSSYGVPAFALPFNLVTLTVLYVLGLHHSPLLASQIAGTPEETLENHVASHLRYQGQLRTIFLPFSGQWTVWQGFSGKWTHQGNWRYAYDFVISDEQQRTCSGDGSRLEDYYCYRKPVLSPVRGRVALVVEDLPDSEIGSADKGNNWGNLVIIQDYRGFWVELSHLAAKSVRVKAGDYVERGTLLGLCGNSGYSPQPHIHVQAQATEAVGGASIPFSFVSYAAAGAFHANDLPPDKETVEPLYPDKYLEGLTGFILDEVHEYEIRRHAKPLGRLRLTVRMAPDGCFYFESPCGRLYFGKHEGTFYFYRVDGDDPWLRRMFLALPRLPLAHRAKLTWSDYVPAGVVSAGPRRMLVDLLSSFHPGLAAVKVTLTFVEQQVVESVVQATAFNPEMRASVEFDGQKGFAVFRTGAYELRRIVHED